LLAAALAELISGAAPEFVALDLRESLDAMGEIAGRTDTEDLLGLIFSRFCIGK
jgi:tRNA modification GTPase